MSLPMLEHSPWVKTANFTAEAGLRLSSPKISRNTFLNIGFHYSSTTTTGTELTGGNLPYKTTTIAKVYSLPVTFQYNFLNGRVRPYIYAGFSGSYLDSKTDGNSNVVFSGF
jgi:outer membrane protein W